MNLPDEYLKERLEMVKKLELGPQRGPKSLSAIKAEVKQLRSILEDKMKVKYIMNYLELEEFIRKHFETDHELVDIELIIFKDINDTPYLERVEINCVV